ncbi:MAG TPA: N-acetyl-gamma-glutamyl-phosphate reductase [Alphaproteobacteria bacterium]|nr:N-acetyl-gamma-glutamyl-phosphate reductase [Alphaproteobacteria bacterium]
MSTEPLIRVAILGASGYTGAEAIRLLSRHPRVRIVALTGDRRAGDLASDVFGHFAVLDLPRLISIKDIVWTDIDAAFLCLPHATTQEVALSVPEHVRLIDISADFRLEQPQLYQKWYAHEHQAPGLQAGAVYALTEFARERLAKARIAACPGCYPTTTLLPLIPLVEEKLISLEDIIVDAKSGVSGAGRSEKQANLHTEVAEGLHAYGVGHHRHMAELDQELSKAAGRPVTATFTPHLMPMNRGMLATIYVRGINGHNAARLHAQLSTRFAKEPFVHVLPFGQTPQTRHVRGSNHCFIGVAQDRLPERAIIVSVLDNLVKGATGQGVQNFNIMFGLPETMGLEQLPLFP